MTIRFFCIDVLYTTIIYSPSHGATCQRTFSHHGTPVNMSLFSWPVPRYGTCRTQRRSAALHGAGGALAPPPGPPPSHPALPAPYWPWRRPQTTTVAAAAAHRPKPLRAAEAVWPSQATFLRGPPRRRCRRCGSPRTCPTATASARQARQSAATISPRNGRSLT